MKRMRLLSLSLMMALMMSACDENTTPSGITAHHQQNQTARASTDTIKLQLEVFTVLPDSIDGCACLFSKNKDDWKNKIYIYADNMQAMAFMTIDNEWQRLDMNGRHAEVNEYSTIAENDLYRISIRIEEIEKTDYTSMYTGEIILKRKSDDSVYTSSVFGSCGC